MSYGIYKNKVKYGCIISFGIVSLLMLLLFLMVIMLLLEIIR